MRKASTEMLEQGTQTPSPLQTSSPLKPKSTEDSHWDWYSKGGTSHPRFRQIRMATATNPAVNANDAMNAIAMEGIPTQRNLIGTRVPGNNRSTKISQQEPIQQFLLRVTGLAWNAQLQIE
jgi:hypothetical protein